MLLSILLVRDIVSLFSQLLTAPILVARSAWLPAPIWAIVRGIGLTSIPLRMDQIFSVLNHDVNHRSSVKPCMLIINFKPCSYVVMKTNNSEGNSKHETKLILVSNLSICSLVPHL
jgi:hypothetical protein